MVLHRPIETTAFIRHVDCFRAGGRFALSAMKRKLEAFASGFIAELARSIASGASFARDDQKFFISHTFLVPPASAMAKNWPSGDGIACQISLLEWSRTEALPSSVTFNKALPDACFC